MGKPRRGRHFFFGPGPTNIPDSVLRAMDVPTIDFNDPTFLAVYKLVVVSLARLLGGPDHVFFYAASGHGAWEATLLNLFSPGERLLMLETGWFSEHWAKMAEKLGLSVEWIRADWRTGPRIEEAAERLAADRAHEIRAVAVVHNETSTGLTMPVAPVREALDAAGHPALLLVDTISSFGSMPFDFAGWGVDAAVGSSQKGLMLPAGLSFTAVSARALAASASARLPRHYFDWQGMRERVPSGFLGTVPTAFFYGLAESLSLIEEEGLEAVIARHARLARAVRAAVEAWSGNRGLSLYCVDPARRSDSVTAILMPEGYDADHLRLIALEEFNLGLGGGLGRLNGHVFRIGHMGDLNEAMVLGAIGAVELALRRAAIPHTPGGPAAALAVL